MKKSRFLYLHPQANATKVASLEALQVAYVVGGINLLGRSEDKQVGLDDHPSAVKTYLRERYRLRRNSSPRGPLELAPSSQKLTTEASLGEIGTASNQVAT